MIDEERASQRSLAQMTIESGRAGSRPCRGAAVALKDGQPLVRAAGVLVGVLRSRSDAAPAAN